MKTGKQCKAIFFAATLALASAQAGAVGSLDPSLLGGVQSAFDGMAEDLTSALSYKAVAPAASTGMVGFEVDVGVSLTETANIAQWGNAIGDTNLKYLPVPKIQARKGLPMGLEVGGVFSTVPGSNIKFWGGEVKYALMGGNVAMPAVAVRGAFTRLQGVELLEMSTRSLDVSVSKGFLFFTPYVGMGRVWGTVTPDATLVGLREATPSAGKLFGGVHVGLGLFKLGYEWDKTGDAASHSLKLGLGF